jgi:hypothetical protein
MGELMANRSVPCLAALFLVTSACRGNDGPRGQVFVDDTKDSGADQAGDAGTDGEVAESTDEDGMDASTADAASHDAGPLNDGSTPKDAAPREDASSVDPDAGDAEAPTDSDASCSDGGSALIDLVLVIDTSGSMAPLACQVYPALAAFEDRLTSDFNLIAVYSMTDANAFVVSAAAQALCGSMDPLADATVTSSPRYLHVNQMVGSTDGFLVLLNSFDTYAPHLRANARTHFLAVSDDDIVGMTAATFKEQMETKLGHGFRYHALAGTPCPAPGQPAPANQHLALADLTGGEKYPFCENAIAADLTEVETVLNASAEADCL